jgi:bacillithiol biosynthesis cysteine-adding enzyme BshC
MRELPVRGIHVRAIGVEPTGDLLDMFSNALREYGAVPADRTHTGAAQATEPGTAESAATRIAVDVRRFPWIRRLAGDYAFNFANVAPLFAGDPTKPESWRDAIARSQSTRRASAEIAIILSAQQERRGAPPEARASAARLASPSTVAVVTGQQAGAFGGPLFTLLKAITTIQLARRVSHEQHAEVVPLFWVDAEDHDWEEVASCTVLDQSFQPRTVMLAPLDGSGDRPIAALTLDEQIQATLNELAVALAVTDFTDWTMGALGDAYRPGRGMAEAFAIWLERILGPHGLVVFESSDPAAKPFAKVVFTRELRTPGRTAALASEAGARLKALGHEPQVAPQPESVSLFHLDGGRRAIRRDGDRFVIGEGSCTAEQLLQEAETSPAHFSPNVLLRPIVQDTLFPTICYVAGPSELAYLGQLSGVYQHFGIPMPLMYPRASATLVDSAGARFLTRYDVPLETLQPQDESALNRLLESLLPKSVEQAMKDAQESIHRSMQGLIDAMPALDPTLAGAAKTTVGKMEHDLRNLHAKMIQAAKRRDETLRRQFTRAQAQVFPLGHPQERTLAVIYFLNRYGPAVVDRLLADLPLELGKHWILVI